jgi:hypothetical protein
MVLRRNVKHGPLYFHERLRARPGLGDRFDGGGRQGKGIDRTQFLDQVMLGHGHPHGVHRAVIEALVDTTGADAGTDEVGPEFLPRGILDVDHGPAVRGAEEEVVDLVTPGMINHEALDDDELIPMAEGGEIAQRRFDGHRWSTEIFLHDLGRNDERIKMAAGSLRSRLSRITTSAPTGGTGTAGACAT